MPAGPALLLPLAGFWVAIVSWLIARAHRQYRAFQVLAAMMLPSGVAPRVDIVVPARNEADNIIGCVSGLLRQDFPRDRVTVTVIDDGSRDNTAALARQAAAGDRRATVIAAGPLPAGWTGKTRACWLGALRGDGEWLCFIDADTTAEPPLLRSAVAAATAGGCDFLSLQPRQVLVTPWERLIIPTGLCVLGFAGDLRGLSRRRYPIAAVNGQFILVRRAVYQRAGGHAAVRREIAEDGALAANIAAIGGRLALMSAAPLISVRMYRSLPQLWEGLAKNVVETLGGVAATAIIAALGFILAWASIGVPAALLASALAVGPSPEALTAVIIASFASTALFALHVATARYLAIPAWYGLLFPLGYSLAALLAIHGLAARRRGAVAWRGRLYAVPRHGLRRNPTSR